MPSCATGRKNKSNENHNNMKKQIPLHQRRNFLKQSATLAAGFFIVPRFVLGKGFTPPSDKITLGFIGLGKQTRGLVGRFAAEKNAQIIAGCDVFSGKQDYFKNWVAQKYSDLGEKRDLNSISTYLDYKELLERTDLDAVVIATPDHWHALPAIDAMKAGKDVYCEKPMAHTVKEGRMMADAAVKYSRIFQTGSMQRSNANFLKACELVRNGYLGKISKALVSVGDPAVSYDLAEEPLPKDLDWNRWCGASKIVPYNAIIAPTSPEDKNWAMWRAYKEFGGGILSDWGAHMFDIAQWALGMDESGPVKFIPPAQKDAKRGLKMVYANGIEMVHEDFGRGYAVRFIGSEGTLDISRQFLESTPENIITAELIPSDTRLYKSENHYQDWLTAIKNRSQTICNAETGHRSASVCNLANIAYQLGQTLDWDPVNEKFVSSPSSANKLRTKKYRKPYKVKL